MNDDEKLKGLIIDEYYKKRDALNTEAPSTFQHNLEEFETKLHRTLDSMDCIENLDFDLDVNFLEIITTAEKIKDTRKGVWEALVFVICSFFIISSAVAVTIIFQTKAILYFEAAVALLLPLSLIPLAGHYRAKEEL